MSMDGRNVESQASGKIKKGATGKTRQSEWLKPLISTSNVDTKPERCIIVREPDRECCSIEVPQRKSCRL